MHYEKSPDKYAHYNVKSSWSGEISMSIGYRNRQAGGAYSVIFACWRQNHGKIKRQGWRLSQPGGPGNPMVFSQPGPRST
jgi:hypothetical protein